MENSPEARSSAPVIQREITGGIQGQVLRVCQLFLLEARPVLYAENHFVIGDPGSFRTIFYSSIPLSCQGLIKSLIILDNEHDLTTSCSAWFPWAEMVILRFDNLCFVDLKASLSRSEESELAIARRPHGWATRALFTSYAFSVMFESLLPYRQLAIRKDSCCSLRARLSVSPLTNTTEWVSHPRSAD